jgi:hypothetical protein
MHWIYWALIASGVFVILIAGFVFLLRWYREKKKMRALARKQALSRTYIASDSPKATRNYGTDTHSPMPEENEPLFTRDERKTAPI